MSEQKKVKISSSDLSASGKIRSPGVAAIPKTKAPKKKTKPTAKAKVPKTSAATPAPKPVFRIRTPDEDDTSQSIIVTKKAATPKLASPRPVGPKLSTMSGTASKETIYIDVDDEITSVIEKLQRAKGTIVALVLPKRAVVMQSIINMRLLKRTADQAGKNVVLVTGEASLLPLAGMAGLHVAATPSSKPTIPPAPDQPNEEPESVNESAEIAAASDNDEDFDSAAEAETPVGELAGLQAAGAAETEELVLDDVPDGDDADDAPAAFAATPVKKDKKLAIPSFDRFRTRAFLGILGLILLIVGLLVATKAMPRATIDIQTNSQVINSSLNVTLDTAAKTIDTDNKIIPAVAQTTPKSGSQQAAATGQQNNGKKASGSVKLVTSVCSLLAPDPDDVPAGSSVSSNGHTYITQETASFSYSGRSNGCLNYTTNSTDILALKAGAEYNLGSGSSFTARSGVTGTGSASGGTDEIVKIVTQGDIDGAKAKLATQDTAQVKQDLEAALKGKGLLPIPSTFIAGDSQVTSNVQAGATAENVTVNVTTPYTMLGIKQTDLRTLVVKAVEGQIDSKKQQILDDGVSKATFTQAGSGSPTGAAVTAKVKSVAGPELNKDDIQRRVAGKKAGDIKMDLGSEPGITDVKVEYSPFWVTVVPKDTNKITVHIAEPASSSEE